MPTHMTVLSSDRFLPIANVVRIMKTVIPKSGKIAKDAKECVQECVSEFVSFITSEASDRLVLPPYHQNVTCHKCAEGNPICIMRIIPIAM